MIINKLLVYGLLLLSLVSCVWGKQHKQAAATYQYTGSLQASRTDSTRIRRMLQINNRLNAALQHISFSAPDSNGQQHIQSVTHARIQQKLQQDETIHSDSGSATVTTAAYTAAGTERILSKKSRISTVTLLILLLLLGGIVFIFRKVYR